MAFGVPCEKRLDTLVKPVGRAKEQIALQVQALNLSPVRGEHRLIVASPIERTAILGSVETEFDGIDARGAQREGRAADHDADQGAGDEAPTMMTIIASSDRYSMKDKRRR